MKEDKDIRSLMFQKLAGTISPEEDAWLDDLLLEDKDVREKWEEVSSFGQSAVGQKLLNSLDEQKAWDRLESEFNNISHSEKLRYFPKSFLVAASFFFALISVSLYFYFNLRIETQGSRITKTKVQQKEAKGITLTLSNGTSVDLSSDRKKNIALAGAVLSVNKKGLDLKETEGDANQWNTLAIPAKLDYKVVLGDGTEVHLNSSSTLRFPFKFDRSKREVYLEGEAFFKVARNEKAPFIVHTSKTDVQVLGTEFNVNAYTGEVVTSLLKGSVKTSAKQGKGVILKPGVQAKYRDENGFITSSFDIGSVTSWMEGSYHFENEDLSTIAKIIPRWYDVSVVFDNKALEDLRITGEINKHKPLAVFVQNIEASTGATCSLQGNVLHVR